MKPTLRRLTWAAGLATSAAVVASVLVAPSAGAAITSITPPSAFNTDSARAITITTNSGADYRFGGSAKLTLVGMPSASYTVTIAPSQAQNNPTATLNLADTGNGLGVDGPLDAGNYGVLTTANGTPGPAPAGGIGAGSDSCPTGSCFTVLPGAALTVSDVSPGSLQAGSAADITLTGDGFERGSRIEVLRPGTTSADSGITANEVPVGAMASTTDADSTEGITTRTQLKRRFTVATTAATGARDVRVTNLDGSNAVCVKCFSVNGSPLLGTAPSGEVNDPGNGLRTITFSGTGLSLQGKPALLFTAEPGSSTREALTLEGRNVRNASATSITADFDLQNAAPSLYRPVVRNPDGSTNACACSFQVRQLRTTTVTSLDSDTATAGTDKSQAAGTTKTFVVNGTGFAKGTRVTVSGDGVTTTLVEFLSDTALKATFQSAATAAPGDRSVTATRTDGTSSAACAACYTVTPAVAPPTSSPTASPTASPSPSANNVEKPTVRVTPSTIVAVEETSFVSGEATPGSTIEIYAYSRPTITYSLVRSARVGPDGRYSFEVRPSGNTRLYARTVTPLGSADSDSIVLTVKTSLNLKVARTGERTYRFTGSLLPKRPNQLITVFYENPNGTRTIAARARNAADGTYNVTRTFTGTGTFTFFTGTGTDNNNAANDSNRVRVTIR